MKKFIVAQSIIILCLTILPACTKDPSAAQGTPSSMLSEGSESIIILETETVETFTNLSEPLEVTVPQDYYAVCTNCSKVEVEQFAKEVRELILARDWSKLSERIAYPITVGNITYEDSNSFLAIPFEVQLSDGALEAIRAEKCTDMFCNYAGIMMGNGEVWIAEVLNADLSSAGLKIIGLNIT